MSVRQVIRSAFSLEEGSASPEEIRQSILSGAHVKGTNLCILVLAILIASIGLNMNSTAVIIGGGVGNLIDRVYRGYVIDYINLEIINFAIFNLADICVTCGTAVLLVILAREMIQEEKEAKARKAAKGD